jgi:hypothetical protein
MAAEQTTEFESAIAMFQCLKLTGLGQAQKEALHKFKRSVAKAFGDCERAKVPARVILAAMLLHAAALNTDEIAREMGGGAPPELKRKIGQTVCEVGLLKKLKPGQDATLHKFKTALADAFGECEKIVSARIILAVLSEHSAELNVRDIAS